MSLQIPICSKAVHWNFSFLKRAPSSPSVGFSWFSSSILRKVCCKNISAASMLYSGSDFLIFFLIQFVFSLTCYVMRTRRVILCSSYNGMPSLSIHHSPGVWYWIIPSVIALASGSIGKRCLLTTVTDKKILQLCWTLTKMATTLCLYHSSRSTTTTYMICWKSSHLIPLRVLSLHRARTSGAYVRQIAHGLSNSFWYCIYLVAYGIALVVNGL